MISEGHAAISQYIIYGKQYYGRTGYTSYTCLWNACPPAPPTPLPLNTEGHVTYLQHIHKSFPNLT